MKKLAVFINCRVHVRNGTPKTCIGVVHMDDYPDSFSDESLRQAAIVLLHRKFFGYPETDVTNVEFEHINTLTSYDDNAVADE